MGFLDTIKEAIGMGAEDDDRSDDYVNEQPNNYDRDDDPKTNRVVNISATAQLQVILVKLVIRNIHQRIDFLFLDLQICRDHKNSLFRYEADLGDRFFYE